MVLISDRVGAAGDGRPGRGQDAGDVGGELDDHRHARELLHQAAACSMYSGTCPTAEPMPRSLMPCGQPKLSSMPSHRSPRLARQDRLPGVLVAGDHQADHQARSGQFALDLLDLLQVHLERAVGDQLDIVEADDAAVTGPDGAVARTVDVDDRRVLAQRLPDRTTPASLEGALDIVGLVGRRRRGQPERVGRLDADELVAQIGHGTSPWVGKTVLPLPDCRVVEVEEFHVRVSAWRSA